MHIVRALLPIFLTAGCKPAPDETQHVAQVDAARGKQAIAKAGCGACHVIPGIRWPEGRTGPSLEGFAEQGLIAGRIPNRPDLLAAYIRDAPATVPGTTMPAMPITTQEARDIAAYLYMAGKR